MADKHLILVCMPSGVTLAGKAEPPEPGQTHLVLEDPLTYSEEVVEEGKMKLGFFPMFVVAHPSMVVVKPETTIPFTSLPPNKAKFLSEAYASTVIQAKMKESGLVTAPASMAEAVKKGPQ